MKPPILLRDHVTSRFFRRRVAPRKPGLLKRIAASFRALIELPAERLMLGLFPWFIILTFIWAAIAKLTH